MTIQELASVAYDALERRTRNDGTTFVCKSDNAPEWVDELCQAAHGDMFPDDWRYEAIQELLGSISDCDDIDDLYDELKPEIWNSDRYEWLASNLRRASYVDEAVSEYGWPDGGIADAIGYGQLWEYREVFDALREFLTEHLEQDEPDDLDEDGQDV